MKLYSLVAVLLVSANAKELFMGDNSELSATVTDSTTTTTKTKTLTPAEKSKEAADKKK